MTTTPETHDEQPETAPLAAEEHDSNPEATPEPSGTETAEPETFPRAYVEKLRKEAAAYRERARRADELAEQLFVAKVAATGRLADPTDLPFDADALDDPARLSAALDDLLANHPHYAARRPTGSVGQGVTGSDAGSVDLAAILRGRA